ncbi:hypothetical protein AAFC00_004818 [Neodothiora populina]|uniref:EKC/KEOPS complex subunit BUD32 n=1 Tax=Neodothiora populina TaxID=2781224 RepID=A0ABR3P3M7_9PEZI
MSTNPGIITSETPRSTHPTAASQTPDPTTNPDASPDQTNPQPPALEPSIHTPPSPFNPSDLVLLTQGAEALVYRTTYLTPTTKCALKYRPKKPWRHRTLDVRLTRARILAEARVLVKCRREMSISGSIGSGSEGAQQQRSSVPAVLGLDWEEGWLALEWIEGWTVRRVLDWWRNERGTIPQGAEGGDAHELKGFLERIGKTIGALHASGVVHGDLTTSNLMLRPFTSPPPSVSAFNDQRHIQQIQSLAGDIVLIDFGLAQQTVQEEDRAVDLYVLERAFASTHPWAEEAFKDVLEAYGTSYKGGKVVLKKLEDVRMRGRKKSMLG